MTTYDLLAEIDWSNGRYTIWLRNPASESKRVLKYLEIGSWDAPTCKFRRASTKRGAIRQAKKGAKVWAKRQVQKNKDRKERAEKSFKINLSCRGKW